MDALVGTALIVPTPLLKKVNFPGLAAPIAKLLLLLGSFPMKGNLKMVPVAAIVAIATTATG